MEDAQQQMDRLRAKLDQVRRENIATFGSESHGYELGPVLTESEVRAFEVEHGVTLPDGYRRFVTEVGHGGPGRYGGAGPYYGLYPLDAWDDYITWIADETPADWLRWPSPLRVGKNELPEIDDDDERDWPPHELLSMYGGILTIGGRGCTYVTGLIVTGELRGRVVYLDAEHYEWPYVVYEEDFLDWYERWLDELLAGYSSTWFGYGPAGDEARLLEIIRDVDDPNLVREAIFNLHKLPSLSDAVWPIVAGGMSHDDETVRAAAVRVLQKSDRDRDFDAIAAAWDDPSLLVREAVIRAVVEVDPERWSERVFQVFLAEPELRGFAFATLQSGRLLTTNRCLTVLDRDDLGEFHAHVLRAADWNPDLATRLFDLLASTDAGVRREAANALAGLGLAPQDERLVRALCAETDEFAQVAMIRLVVAAEERRAAPRLLELTQEGNDFQRLAAVKALCELGEDRVVAVAEQQLDVHRPPEAPGRGHTRTIAELVREYLEASPSPKLRALGQLA